MTLAVTYDLGSYLDENWRELLAGLGRTLQVSAIAIVGALLIGILL
jgi:ABC-type amino acid transport system permease subunit